MGRGPARPIKFREDAPRPGPAYQSFRGWASARPGPSKFQRVGRGSTQPIAFSNFHGPAHHIFNKSRPGPARPRQTAHDKPCFVVLVISIRQRYGPFNKKCHFGPSPKTLFCVSKPAGFFYMRFLIHFAPTMRANVLVHVSYIFGVEAIEVGWGLCLVSCVGNPSAQGQRR